MEKEIKKNAQVPRTVVLDPSNSAILTNRRESKIETKDQERKKGGERRWSVSAKIWMKTIISFKPNS